METLEKLIAGPLFEESSEDVKGWQKETVNYVASNRSKILRQIRAIAKTKRKQSLQTADVEDIYSEILLYLYNCDDYNINKAIDRSSTGNIVSLEGYLNVCIKFCVIRHCNQMKNVETDTMSDTIISGEDKELSIFDTIPDKSSDITLDHLVYDFRTLCESCTPVRYRYGTDIYLVLYIRLLTSFDVTGETYKTILSILGITKKDLSKIEKGSEDEIMFGFAKAISLSDASEAISILEEYVYSSNLIKDMVNSFKD